MSMMPEIVNFANTFYYQISLSFFSLSLSQSHTHEQTHTDTHRHAPPTHTHTHPKTHTLFQKALKRPEMQASSEITVAIDLKIFFLMNMHSHVQYVFHNRFKEGKPVVTVMIGPQLLRYHLQQKNRST